MSSLPFVPAILGKKTVRMGEQRYDESSNHELVGCLALPSITLEEVGNITVLRRAL